MGKKIYLSALTTALLVMQLAVVARGQVYVIGGGDVLEISVWKNADLTRTVTVRPDGMISLPLIYDIKAAGSAVEELRAKIVQTLSASNLISDPNVLVSVVEATSYRVYALGALMTNGMYPLAEPVTALQLMAQAGGPTDEADLSEAFVLRGQVRIPLDLDIKSQTQTKITNPVLVPGDVLVVPQRIAPQQEPVYRILVAGEVMTPQSMPFQKGITVLDAFVHAGGGTEFADVDSVKVIRREEGKKEQVLRVDLNKVMKKGDLRGNIGLVPGDIVIVP